MRSYGPRRTLPAAGPASAPALSPAFLDRLLRDFLFLATILLTWFTVAPFPDWSDPRLLEPSSEADPVKQAVTLWLTGALAIYALSKRTSLVFRAASLPLMLTFGAFAISAVLSPYPDLAGRRIVLAGMTLFQTVMLLLLPQGREHFARLLAAAALIVLGACYFGVVYMPQLSIHQATNVTEQGLAGDWRGFFAHKNDAGASMALLIFIGMFVARAWNWLAGAAIVLFAAIFLYFTYDKSSLGLLPVALTVAFFAQRLRSTAAVFACVVGVPLLINLLTVGSVMFEPINHLVAGLVWDPTFTGRDDIWRFALEQAAQRPLFGFGFEAFWDSPSVVDSWKYLGSWAFGASHAHNGALNLLVTTGFVGLTFALWWIVAQPFANFLRLRRAQQDDALTTLFLQLWVFGLCLSGIESVFFKGGNEIWFLMAVSIFGLRFKTIATNVA